MPPGTGDRPRHGRSIGARRPGVRALALAAAIGLATAPAFAAAAARLGVTASVDRAELAEDEVLVLTVRVESDEASPAIDLHEADLPFRVLSRSWSSDVSVGLGGGAGVQILRTRVLTLALSPRKKGELVIPPVVATVKGVRRQTEPIRVKVHAAAGPRAPAQPPDRSGGSWRGWEKDLSLEVEVDRREAFLGEQVTATVWLLSPVGVVDVEAYQPPLYDGFWVEEIERPQRLGFQVRNVRGVPMRAYLLHRLALFPTRAGALELGPFRIEVKVRLGPDSFLSRFSELRQARRASAPVSLRVKPLPPGAPAGFQAVNVGSFRLEATSTERSVPAGQPVAVRVTAAGDGNVRTLSLPQLPAIAGARRFEATAADDLQRRGARVGGSRTLETVLVPEGPGELVVPALEWPFFDPGSGRYELARTGELRIAVVPAPPAPAVERGPGSPAPVLGPIRAAGALAPRAPPPWRRAPFLAAVALAPLAFAGLAAADAWRRRAAAGAPARRARGAGERARKRLRAAERRLAGDRDGALAEVERALEGYAADRLGRGTAGLTRAELTAALRAGGAADAALVALEAALDACDAARFAGAAEPDEVVALAGRALAALDPPLGSEPGRSR